MRTSYLAQALSVLLGILCWLLETLNILQTKFNAFRLIITTTTGGGGGSSSSSSSSSSGSSSSSLFVSMGVRGKPRMYYSLAGLLYRRFGRSNFGHQMPPRLPTRSAL
jgi:hypothetical protein